MFLKEAGNASIQCNRISVNMISGRLATIFHHKPVLDVITTQHLVSQQDVEGQTDGVPGEYTQRKREELVMFGHCSCFVVLAQNQY